MEGDDGLRTLECLRGRLLAERAATRVAKEDAELMGSKVVELENQLRVEIKTKNKAEKKLKFLKEKFESLRIKFVLEISELSNSSDNFESSWSSSSTSSVTKNPEENQNPKPQFSDSDKCSIEEINHYVSETSSSNQNHNSPSGEKTSNPQNPPNSKHIVDFLENFRKSESIQGCEDSNNDDQSLESSMRGMEINGGNDRVEDDENVDNSLALVLVPPSLLAPQKAELKKVNNSVGEVLDALRHAREKLQISMERRRVIKFGLIGTQIC